MNEELATVQMLYGECSATPALSSFLCIYLILKTPLKISHFSTNFESEKKKQRKKILLYKNPLAKTTLEITEEKAMNMQFVNWTSVLN